VLYQFPEPLLPQHLLIKARSLLTKTAILL